ncbi:hypothetical protein GQR58_001388 [Nymphon striatum]|nr:hypothetical protein GQR58_001388 [Nymphon striatum]
MCPACTNVWVRDLGNYRFPVEKIGECPTQCGRKPLCLKRKVYDKCVLPVLTYRYPVEKIGECPTQYGKKPLGLKRKVSKKCLLPVLTHGSETWAITDTLLRKLVSAQHSMERNLSACSGRYPVEKIGECPTQYGKKPLCLKREVYDKCVLPVLTYGSETWAITNTLLRKLVSAQNSRKRNILSMRWRYRITDNTDTLLKKLASAQHIWKETSLLEAEGIRKMCPACTNVWVRDLGNYRYSVEKIGVCPTQYGKKPLCLKRKVYDKCVLLVYLGNYRYHVEKIGECPTQFGKKPLCLKPKVYDKCVLPVLTYGSETWAITDTLLRKLVSAQNSRKRKILGVRWRYRITDNTDTLLKKLASAQHTEGIRQMCPACTNVWVRDLGNYRYPVEKIGECPTQYGKKPLCLKRERKVYDKCVMPVLTYGSKSWAITDTLLRKLVSAQHSMERNLSSLLEAEGIRQMCPACTNVWARDLGNYRYPVEKIGECPTQFGKKPLCLKRKLKSNRIFSCIIMMYVHLIT